jgi:hypothetical protein
MDRKTRKCVQGKYALAYDIEQENAACYHNRDAWRLVALMLDDGESHQPYLGYPRGRFQAPSSLAA